ncbi:18455_t:CDS:1 [Acaulospora morrowiae]|uniref:18455_t:CDS:1 n=1 Tax=Acaulospora morrowiae TaxID=94023 RepID=A0A9N9FZR1_9GLOM|nr:18455_t:CDS:1 [Acaulospora morrowiae]
MDEQLCCLSKLVIKFLKKRTPKKRNVTVPSLPTECMQQVFQHIVDQGEGLYRLYPFLLVNRYWCKNVVPFLWARPFEDLKPENRYKIMLIYLSSLNDQEKSELNSSLKPYKITIPNLKPPLFDYPMLLEELSYKNVEMTAHSCIYKWNSEAFKQKEKEEQILVLSTALCKLFLRKSTNLRTFIIDKFLGHSDIPDCSIFVYNQPGLRNISSLSIDYTRPIMENTIRLLEAIPSICTSIRCLNIRIPFFESNPEVIQAVVEIIQSQTCLTEFSLEGVRSGESKDIINALHQSITLTIIKLENVNITTTTLSTLSLCQNLQSLSILRCQGLTVEEITGAGSSNSNENLWNRMRFNLKILHLKSSPRFPAIPASIIRSAGDFLQELSLDVITTETVESITSRCPNILNLQLYNFLPQHNSLLGKLFQGLKHIKKLTISMHHRHMNRENMAISGRELPVSLEYLKLQCSFNNAQLENLLRECRSPLKTLIIDFRKFEYLDLKVITNFVKSKRTLKYLGIGGRIGWCAAEVKELEILKQRYGVNLIPRPDVDRW